MNNGLVAAENARVIQYHLQISVELLRLSCLQETWSLRSSEGGACEDAVVRQNLADALACDRAETDFGLSCGRRTTRRLGLMYVAFPLPEAFQQDGVRRAVEAEATRD